MLKIKQRLIFREDNVILQNFWGFWRRDIETFQKSDFLTSGGRYRVTEALLGDFSEGLLIEIEAPIEVEVTFEAQINANVNGAIAHANAPGAIARAIALGAKAYADVDGAKAYANVPGAEAYANAPGTEAHANAPGAKAYATLTGALAIPLP